MTRTPVLERAACRALPVLMYHSVSHVPDGPMRRLAVPAPILADQLGALAGAGYRLLGLTEALRERRADPDGRVVAVTFDDGFVDFLTAGLDVLAEVGARATLYLAVAHLGRDAVWMGSHASDFGPLMDWAQVAEVASYGVEIGNHSLIHAPLDVLPRGALDVQARVSRELLRQHTQRPVWSFAYPHGYHSLAVRAAVARAGHRTACEVGHRLYTVDDSRLGIPRLQITADHGVEDVLRLVETGGSTFVPAVKDLLRPGWRLVRRVAKDGLGVRLT